MSNLKINGGGYASPCCHTIELESAEALLKTSGNLPSMTETNPTNNGNNVKMW